MSEFTQDKHQVKINRGCLGKALALNLATVFPHP